MNNNNLSNSPISQTAYDSQSSWGMLAIINLYDCGENLIKDPETIKKFIYELCDEIDMKRYGEPMIARFAEGALEGYSALQFIETSSITLHFDEEKNRAFIDIFSCKHFDSTKASEFCQKYFQAKLVQMQNILRQ